MRINNIKLEFDVMDANLAVLAENEMEKLTKLKIPEGTSWSQILIIQCEAVFNFFDQIFGEGTSKQIFGEKTNLELCLDAIEQFKKEFNRDAQIATNNIKSRLGNQYSSNRAQRRSKK